MNVNGAAHERMRARGPEAVAGGVAARDERGGT
jgi:hypothetical protein